MRFVLAGIPLKNNNIPVYPIMLATLTERLQSVPKILLDIIRNDDSAFVRAIAIDNFCYLTGYKKTGPLDVDGPKKYFKEHELGIMKKMGEDDSTPLAKGEPFYPQQIKL